MIPALYTLSKTRLLFFLRYSTRIESFIQKIECSGSERKHSYFTPSAVAVPVHMFNCNAFFSIQIVCKCAQRWLYVILNLANFIYVVRLFRFFHVFLSSRFACSSSNRMFIKIRFFFNQSHALKRSD